MSSNTLPKLHNAMWPGLVGKGDEEGQEPPISLERMLELTAGAEVNGQKIDGIDYFLFLPHTDPDFLFPSGLNYQPSHLGSCGFGRSLLFYRLENCGQRPNCCSGCPGSFGSELICLGYRQRKFPFGHGQIPDLVRHGQIDYTLGGNFS